ncbi:MAG: FAD-dependent oxidoreductase [Gammaproteobacteria bacterium]
MAIPRHARVAAVEEPGTGTRLLELVGDDPLCFTGGQYIIVDSGLVLPSGKAVKRAYSILSPDAEQGRFQIAVKRIPGGPGSGFMHQIGVGDDIRFSGPWGRFFPQDGLSGPALILATDTGITAALGLVQGSRFQALAPLSILIWLRTAPEYFLPEFLVRDRSPPLCTPFRIAPIPPIGHPERIVHARTVLREVLAGVAIEQAFVCGDGTVNYALLDDLLAAGIPATKDNLESFFNMPKKSL